MPVLGLCRIVGRTIGVDAAFDIAVLVGAMNAGWRESRTAHPRDDSLLRGRIVSGHHRCNSFVAIPPIRGSSFLLSCRRP